MNKIDVSKLANEIYVSLNELYHQDLAKSNKEIKENKDAGLGHLLANQLDDLKRHNERFTVRLIQKVVDELQKDE